MAWKWDTPAAATFRISAAVDMDGNYALDGEQAVGSKSVSFGSVAGDASLETLCTGDTATAVTGTRYGLVSTFLNYVMDGSYLASTARKTVTYKAEEVA